MAHGSETAPAPRGPHPTAPKRGRLRNAMMASLLGLGLGLGSGSCRTAGAQEPGTPTGLRAETSYIAWLALLLPLLILIQWCLVLLRNHVRDRIHRMPRTSDPTLPTLRTLPRSASPTTKETIYRTDPPDSSEPDLEAVIGEELADVFAEAALQFDESVNDAGLRELLIALATSVAARSEARVELTEVEQQALRTELIAAVLAAFDLASAQPDRLAQSR